MVKFHNTLVDDVLKLEGISVCIVKVRMQTRLGDPGPSQYRSMAFPGSSVVGHRSGGPPRSARSSSMVPDVSARSVVELARRPLE